VGRCSDGRGSGSSGTLRKRKFAKPAYTIITNHDCTDVRFGRLHWRLTPLKAKIIKRLLEAASTPFPEVHRSELVRVSGAYSEMRNLFQGDPAWGQLLVSMGMKRKGFYRAGTTRELMILHKRVFPDSKRT